MKNSHWLATLTAAVAVLFVSVDASGAAIGVNVSMPDSFGGWQYHADVYQTSETRAGYVIQDNWNQLARDGGTPPLDRSGATAYPLIDNSGATTAATVAINADFTWGTFNNVEAGAAGSTPLTPIDQNQLRLMNGVAGYNGGNSGNLFSFTNIPYSVYDVVVYPANAAGRTGSLQLNGAGDTYHFETYESPVTEDAISNGQSPWVVATSTTAGVFTPANIVVFENVTGASLDIFHEAISGNSGIGAVQIVAVPEPASLSLLVLAAVLVRVVQCRSRS